MCGGTVEVFVARAARRGARGLRRGVRGGGARRSTARRSRRCVDGAAAPAPSSPSSTAACIGGLGGPELLDHTRRPRPRRAQRARHERAAPLRRRRRGARQRADRPPARRSACRRRSCWSARSTTRRRSPALAGAGRLPRRDRRRARGVRALRALLARRDGPRRLARGGDRGARARAARRGDRLQPRPEVRRAGDPRGAAQRRRLHRRARQPPHGARTATARLLAAGARRGGARARPLAVRARHRRRDARGGRDLDHGRGHRRALGARRASRWSAPRARSAPAEPQLLDAVSMSRSLPSPSHGDDAHRGAREQACALPGRRAAPSTARTARARAAPGARGARRSSRGPRRSSPSRARDHAVDRARIDRRLVAERDDDRLDAPGERGDARAQRRRLALLPSPRRCTGSAPWSSTAARTRRRGRRARRPRARRRARRPSRAARARAAGGPRAARAASASRSADRARPPRGRARRSAVRRRSSTDARHQTVDPPRGK